MQQISLVFEEDRKNPRFCECCGAKVVEYKHSINQGLVNSLYKLYQAGGGPINLHEIKLLKTEWTNFQKLRYWNLVSKVEREDKSHIGGAWQITRLGRSFIQNGVGIQKSVWTFRGETTKYEGNTIFFNDLHDKEVKKKPDYARESKPHRKKNDS